MCTPPVRESYSTGGPTAGRPYFCYFSSRHFTQSSDRPPSCYERFQCTVEYMCTDFQLLRDIVQSQRFEFAAKTSSLSRGSSSTGQLYAICLNGLGMFCHGERVDEPFQEGDPQLAVLASAKMCKNNHVALHALAPSCHGGLVDLCVGTTSVGGHLSIGVTRLTKAIRLPGCST